MFRRIRDWLRLSKTKVVPDRAWISWEYDGRNVTAKDAFGRRMSVAVEEIREVGIETTDQGPFVEDVFWVIRTETNSIHIPQESPVSFQLMDLFGSWPGFDWGALTAAMGCADNRYFLCWRHSSIQERA